MLPFGGGSSSEDSGSAASSGTIWGLLLILLGAGGWYLSSAPVITANWEADSGNVWTVPFGGGAGKIFKIGSQNMNAQLQAFYNAVKPDIGPDWQLRLQLQFLFPK